MLVSRLFNPFLPQFVCLHLHCSSGLPYFAIAGFHGNDVRSQAQLFNCICFYFSAHTEHRNCWGSFFSAVVLCIIPLVAHIHIIVSAATHSVAQLKQQQRVIQVIRLLTAAVLR